MGQLRTIVQTTIRRAPGGSRPALVQRWGALSLLLILAVTLSACSFSTDTVATVGGTKITRGELNAFGANTTASQASALQVLIYNSLLEEEARAQKIDVTSADLAAQAQKDITALQGTESFTTTLLQNGITSGPAYLQRSRQQVLIEKLRPSWLKGNVNALMLQQIVTDSPQKAQEAVQKGRAGTPFAELVKTYATADMQDPQQYTIPTSISVNSLPAQIKAQFSEVKQGAYSNPIPNNGRYIVLYISKLESRAPTEQDTNELIVTWLDSLRAKYPVKILDPTLQGALGR